MFSLLRVSILRRKEKAKMGSAGSSEYRPSSKLEPGQAILVIQVSYHYDGRCLTKLDVVTGTLPEMQNRFDFILRDPDLYAQINYPCSPQSGRFATLDDMTLIQPDQPKITRKIPNVWNL